MKPKPRQAQLKVVGSLANQRFTKDHINLCCTLVSLLIIFHSGVSLAQDRVVTGRVTGEFDKQPIPGVNVIAKGTTVGTVTDMEGNYQLSLPETIQILSFSFIGFKTQEVQINGRTLIDVVFADDVKQLSEIVVTGIGVPIEKKMLAISVESVGSEKLPMVPTASIDQALIGKIPGALIMSGNGSPGSEISILLRGINSLNKGTLPMIMVDGVQMGVTNLNSLDMNSVDRVEVVQGAAAATIYGAQGANGVIQIFTKRGIKGKINVDFSTSVANNKWLNTGGLAKANLHSYLTNADNYVIGASGDTLVQDPATLLYNTNVVWDPFDTAVVTNKPYNRNLQYHDHFKEFYKSALTTNYNLSVSGGSENIDFNLSASNNHQESNFKGDGYNDRSNFVVNVGIDLTPKLKFRSISQLIYTKNTVNIHNKQGFGINGLVSGVLDARPFADLSAKDTQGNFGVNYGDAAGVLLFNPNYSLQYTTTDEKKIDLLQNFELDYTPIKFVDINLKYGINYRNATVKYSAENQSTNANSDATGYWESWFNGNDNTGELSTFENSLTSQNFIATGTTVFDFEKDFHLSIPLKSTTLFGYDYRSRNEHDYDTYGLGVPLLPPTTANQATTFKIDNDYTTEFITYGYLINQRFDWGDLAGVSAGFRSDYSSAFGSGSKPFTFPRGDAFVRISGFDFWDRSGVSKVILDWKLRGAYGQAGIQPQPFDRFPALSTRTIGNTNAYLLGANQSNPRLSVEVSEELEVGTDILFENFSSNLFRSNALSFTYWTRNTNNAIFNVDVPPSLGTGTILDNALTIGAKGIQASLTSTVVRGKNFKWNLTSNFSKQTSIIKSIKGDTEIVAGASVLKAGQEVGQFYGHLMLHDLHEADPNTGQPFIPGDSIANYQVASNGWVVDKRTKTPYITQGNYSLGSTFPKFNISVINEFTFRKFLSFGFQIDWVNGGKIYNATKSWMYRDGIHSDYTKEIEINGQSGAWTAFYNGVYNGVEPAGVKNYFYEDGSFVRLRNAYVGFDVAQLVKTKIRKLQLVLSGRNLLTWTNYTGMDPEVSTVFTSGVLYQRVDDHVLPNFRSYQVTLYVGF